MNKLIISLLPAAAFANNAFAAFLPPNNLHLQDSAMFAPNMTEEEFNQIVDEAVAIYKPIAKKHGGTLTANKRWSDGTVNASANQFFGSWSINMYGGLARRPEVTPDGFALVVCHELGHHFGGFPFASGWAGDEGQSDYFATQSCARQIWGTQTLVNATFRETALPIVKEKCDAVWSIVEEQNLCYRTAMAGESLAVLLGALRDGPVPSFETPDTSVVTATDHQHPDAQCRLDTYFAGSLCKANFDQNLIPGRKHPKGQGSLDAESEAASVSCTASGTFEIGLRPTCWFKPRM